jgi:hypothetical protein
MKSRSDIYIIPSAKYLRFIQYECVSFDTNIYLTSNTNITGNDYQGNFVAHGTLVNLSKKGKKRFNCMYEGCNCVLE